MCNMSLCVSCRVHIIIIIQWCDRLAKAQILMVKWGKGWTGKWQCRKMCIRPVKYTTGGDENHFNVLLIVRDKVSQDSIHRPPLLKRKESWSLTPTPTKLKSVGVFSSVDWSVNLPFADWTAGYSSSGGAALIPVDLVWQYWRPGTRSSGGSCTHVAYGSCTHVAYGSCTHVAYGSCTHVAYSDFR